MEAFQFAIVAIIAVAILLVAGPILLSIVQTFLNANPAPNSSNSPSITNSVSNAITQGTAQTDQLAVPIELMVFVVYGVIAWYNPNRTIGIVQIIVIILLGFLYSVINQPLQSFISPNAPVSANTYFPQTVAAWNSGFILFIAFIGLIATTIMHFRTPDNNQMTP